MRLYLFHAAFAPNPEAEQADERSNHLMVGGRRVHQPRAKVPRCHIVLSCKDEAGKTWTVRIADWLPWLFIHSKITSDDQEELLKQSSIASVRVVQRIQFVGFTNQKQQNLLECRCTRWPPWIDKKYTNYKLEHTVKPHTKFFTESGLRSGAWFDIQRLPPLEAACTQLTCSYHQLQPAPEVNKPPNLTVMAYDLETSGLDPKKCRIHQVCLVFWDTANPVQRDPRSMVVCTQPTAAVDGTVVHQVDTELHLLQVIRDTIRKYNPDVCTGYNLAFDNGFIETRLRDYPSLKNDFNVSRIPQVHSAFEEQVLTSTALGTNKRTLWSMPGRFVLDLFLFAKANHPGKPSYKLDAMGKEFVGAGKDDVPWGTILESFGPAGTPELRGTVAHYCEIDGFLCLQLVDKWAAHTACLEEASVCAVNVSSIVDTGRQIKTISLILAELFGTYFYNPPPSIGDDEQGQGYEGATVIDTQKGFYGGECDQVVLLDFSRYAHAWHACEYRSGLASNMT